MKGGHQQSVNPAAPKKGVFDLLDFDWFYFPEYVRAKGKQ